MDSNDIYFTEVYHGQIHQEPSTLGIILRAPLLLTGIGGAWMLGGYLDGKHVPGFVTQE